jgi:hypothetical protein
MKIKQTLSYALAGWAAGVIATISAGFCWPIIFPAIVRINHYYGSGPGMPFIIGLVMLFASPASLIGGMIGGWVPKEGGRREQYMMAAVFGVLLSIPFTCYGLWFFTGW